MVVQLIEGRVTDPGGLPQAFEERVAALVHNDGWLGLTAGVTAESRFVAVVRFTASGPRELWHGLADDLTVDSAPEVEQILGGGSDDAGFVQVIRGRARDPERLRSLRGDLERVAAYRPETIGGTMAWHDRDRFTRTMYFTSEAAARAGPPGGFPDDMQTTIRAFLEAAELTFLDLPEPWLRSP